MDSTKDYKTPLTGILLVILFISIFLLSLFKLLNLDIWFHLKSGQIILETGRFLYKDIFSYTAEGMDWIYHEWLFGVITYKIYSLLGINGLVLFKSVIILTAFAVLYLDMKLRGVNPYLSSFILILAATAARFRFVERPHIFKYFFLAVFIYLLDCYRFKGKNRLLLLPIMQILWTNLHGSFLLGPVVISLYLIETILKREWERARILTTSLALTFAASLINPYGWRLILFSLHFGDMEVLASINEWVPTQLGDFYSVFGMLFIFAIASFAVSGLISRRVDFADLLIFSLFSYLSLKAFRFTALFSFVVAPITACNWQRIMQRYGYTAFKRWVLSAAAVLIIILSIIVETKRNPALVFGLGQDPAFPKGALDFLKGIKIEGNMYNSYIFGGYLMWELYPERKVFVDGRIEVYPEWLQKNFISNHSWPAFLNAVGKYDINYAIIAYKTDTLGELISRDPGWALVYWDDVARVYVGRTQRNSQIIDSYGYELLIDPEGFGEETLAAILKEGRGDRLAVELRRRIELNRADVWAWYWLGRVYSQIGKKADALLVWKEGVRIKPDADIYNNIGSLLYEQKRYQDAITNYKLAVEIDKGFAEAYYNLGSIYEELGEKDKAAAAYKKFIKYAGPEYAQAVKEVNQRLINR